MTTTTRQIHIIGGGTVFPIRPHLALSAPAHGATAWAIHDAIMGQFFPGSVDVYLYTTRMAGDEYRAWHVSDMLGADQFIPDPEDEGPTPGLHLDTNADIASLLDKLVEDPAPKIIFLPAALCDFDVESIDSIRKDPERGIVHTSVLPGKTLPRLMSRDYLPIPSDPDDYGADDPPTAALRLALVPAMKIIERIRMTRKDIFLVGFKTTTNATPQEQFEAGLTLVKKASCNLVLANDTARRVNMIITPEQAPYCVTRDRGKAIDKLVEMALARANGHFTRSNVVDGDPVPWASNHVPATLRTVVDYCIERGAYKPFLGATVGHFAYKISDTKFATSRRKTDYNNLSFYGMVIVDAQADGSVEARGSKPSVGGQSQRIIFANHPDVDCIVHFHCPLRETSLGLMAMRSQESHECGSHECGQNTSDGLSIFIVPVVDPYSGVIVDGQAIKAVMLAKHGANIAFNRNANPQAIINFIEAHWDLNRSTSEIPEIDA